MSDFIDPAKRDAFNKNMDEELLSRGFEYHDDWQFGPQSGGSNNREFFGLSLMRHDHGYWLILNCRGCRSSGLNLGSSNNAEDIIAVRDSLRDSLELLW